MDNNTAGEDSRKEFLFQHLLAMFHTLALQQLGKLVNPLTGKTERDLNQARITIDILQMIKDKTVGNLTAGEQGLLERIVMELQMNYVDELSRKEGVPQEEKESVVQAADEGERPAQASPDSSKAGAKKVETKKKKRTAKAKKTKKHAVKGKEGKKKE